MFPNSTSERPPSLLDIETNLRLSPMQKGAKSIKEFLKQKGKSKMTKESAAKELNVTVKTVANMLTKGQLAGDGDKGATDESVAAWKQKQQSVKNQDMVQQALDNNPLDEVMQRLVNVENIDTTQAIEEEDYLVKRSYEAGFWDGKQEGKSEVPEFDFEELLALARSEM